MSQAMRDDVESPNVILDRILRDLVGLLTDEEPEFRPTSAALIRAWRLIAKVGDHLGDRLPFGYACVDGEGGVRFEWQHGNRQLSVQIPAHEGGREYIYHQEDKSHRIEEPVTPSLLTKWLYWLVAE